MFIIKFIDSIVTGPWRFCYVCPILQPPQRLPSIYYDHYCVHSKPELRNLRIDGSYAFCNERYGKLPGINNFILLAHLLEDHESLWYGAMSIHVLVCCQNFPLIKFFSEIIEPISTKFDKNPLLRKEIK